MSNIDLQMHRLGRVIIGRRVRKMKTGLQLRLGYHLLKRMF
jgi:hypothetical protein